MRQDRLIRARRPSEPQLDLQRSLPISHALQETPIVKQRLLVVRVRGKQLLEGFDRLIVERGMLVVQGKLKLGPPPHLRLQARPEQDIPMQSNGAVQLSLAAKQRPQSEVGLQGLRVQLGSLGELSDGGIGVIGE